MWDAFVNYLGSPAQQWQWWAAFFIMVLHQRLTDSTIKTLFKNTTLLFSHEHRTHERIKALWFEMAELRNDHVRTVHTMRACPHVSAASSAPDSASPDPPPHPGLSL